MCAPSSSPMVNVSWDWEIWVQTVWAFLSVSLPSTRLWQESNHISAYPSHWTLVPTRKAFWMILCTLDSGISALPVRRTTNLSKNSCRPQYDASVATAWFSSKTLEIPMRSVSWTNTAITTVPSTMTSREPLRLPLPACLLRCALPRPSWVKTESYSKVLVKLLSVSPSFAWWQCDRTEWARKLLARISGLWTAKVGWIKNKHFPKKSIL